MLTAPTDKSEAFRLGCDRLPASRPWAACHPISASVAHSDFDDDDLPDREGEDSSVSVWPRRLLTWALALAGLGLGLLIPYMLYLNHQVSARFGQLQWQLPTRVFARPLQLQQGMAMDAATLKTELDAAAYAEDAQAERPGKYHRDGGTWRIASRGFDDVTGPVPPSRIEVRLAGGKVQSIRDLVGNRDVSQVRLDAARIATLYGQKQEERRLVQIEEVPENLVTGLQAVEDRDFARHHGIDLSGMLRAMFVNLRSGEAKQGASTLTQQLARSGLLGIGRERTLKRKINEILYAIIIDARYDKRTILEAYLNQVYMGQRGQQAIHGVAAGSEFWFGRDLADLRNEQIALLIAIVRGPSYYDPRRQPERATQRRNLVLDVMLETGLIDAAEHRRARAAPLGVTEKPGSRPANRFPAYVDVVRRQLQSAYSAEMLQGAGLAVMTGMSPSAQAYAEGAVTRTLKDLGKRKVPLQAGLVLTDTRTGDVLAVVGSREFGEHGFNRAVEAKRPVGSLLKPFVYMLALSQPGRWSLASYLDDSPITVRQGNGRNWTPTNSDGRSHGHVRLMDALALSYNQATVRLGMQQDLNRLTDVIHQLTGIRAQPNPSLLLGSVDESPYAMAQLYQFLATGGQKQPLHAVRGVLDRDGRLLKRFDAAVPAASPDDAAVVALVTIALQHAISNGTGRQLVSDGLGKLSPAGKTGTSNDGRDSWFAGWTGDHLAVIWMGNDDNKSTGLYGATGAMRVWSNIFRRLPSGPLQLNPSVKLDRQPVVDNAITDPGCPGARMFAFLPGYVPAFRSCYYAPPAQDVYGDPYPDPMQDGQSPQPAERGGFWSNLFGRRRQQQAPSEPASGGDLDPSKRLPPSTPQPAAEPQP